MPAPSMTHLIRRDKRGVLYLKVSVPAQLRPLFKNRQHIVTNLKETDLAKVQNQRDILVGKIKEFFEEARGHEVTLMAADLNAKVRQKGKEAGPDVLAAAVAVSKVKGVQKGVELVERALGTWIDLDHGEADWFNLQKFTYRTQLRYQHSVRLLREHLKREGIPENACEVDSKVAASFRRHLVAANVHKETANSYLSALKSRWANWIEESVIDGPNPFDLRMPTQRIGVEASRRKWKADELETLFIGGMEQELFDIVALLALTGARRTEIASLTVDDIEGDWIQIRRGKTSNAVRRVPLADCLKAGMRDVAEHAKEDGRLFSIRPDAVTIHFKAYRDALGLTDPKTVLHSLRHSFVSLASAAGCPKHHIKAVVGHSKSDVTDNYLEVDDDSKAAVVNAVAARLPVAVREAIEMRFGTR